MTDPGVENLEPDLDIDARGIRAWVEPADRDVDDGDFVLLLTDGDATVRITGGAGGSRQMAVFGMERLVGAAKQLAALMQEKPHHGAWNGPGM